MLATGRSAALLLAALFGSSGCGAGSSTPEAAPASSAASAAPAARCAGPDQQVRVPSYGPSGYVGDLPGDMPPHYAENHAFQQRLRLCGDDLERATAAASRAQRALEDLEAVTPEAVRSALGHLGHDRRSITVAGAGETVTFVAEVGGSAGQMNLCLDGTVGPDGASVRGNAMYAEGGCIKPVGGH